MEIVYLCNFCEEYFKEKDEAEKHEDVCGGNPKNKITNKEVLKLSRIKDDFEEALEYMFLFKYNENDLEVFKKEFNRATANNCPASIYENAKYILDIIRSTEYIRADTNLKWFKNIVERDNSRFIDAIEKYMKEE